MEFMDGHLLTEAYFQGWIDRDADAVLEVISADGTYEEPATRRRGDRSGAKISGAAWRGSGLRFPT